MLALWALGCEMAAVDLDAYLLKTQNVSQLFG